MTEALTPFRAGALQRFVDGPAEHEISAEDLHRLADGGSNHGLAETTDGTAKRCLPIVRAVLRALEHLAGQQQGKGGGVDERRIRPPELLRPVRAGEFVGDQLIGGMRVRDSQQRLGKAHHRNALVRTQVIGMEECVDARGLVRANALDQCTRGRGRFAVFAGV